MLENSNLARKYTPICSFRKYTFQCLGPIHFADVSIFLQKISVFVQKSTFTQSNSFRAVLERFFSYFCSFCNTKGYYYWKHNFCKLCVRNPASRLLQNGQKSEKWQRRHSFPTWRQRQLFLTLFCFFCQG